MRTLAASLIAEKNKLTNRPIRLYIVEDGPLLLEVLRYAEYSTNVVYPTGSGTTYFAAPIKYETVTENMAAEVDQINISFGNVDQSFVHYLEQHDGLRNCKVTIRTVFADLLNDATAFTDDIFYVSSAVMNQTSAMFSLKSKMDLLSIELPLRRFYREVCQWKFKSSECGYTGGETDCNRTSTRCKALANLTRFGGFPGTGASIWRVFVG